MRARALAALAAASLAGCSVDGGEKAKASLWAGTTTLVGLRVGPVVGGVGWVGSEGSTAEPFPEASGAEPGE
jgi:hypothetical protein